MVPSEILQRVFLIKNGKSTGTCFLVTINKRNYLITAKHIFDSSTSNTSEISVEIFNNSKWDSQKGIILYHKDEQIDIAVIDLESTTEQPFPIEIGKGNYYLSQDSWFLGYPFGMKMDDDKMGNVNRGYPIPFVKKAIISAFQTDEKGMTQIFLDGHNNPGFSGGPVVVKNIDKQGKNGMRIIGVISAYLNDSKIIETPFGILKNNENSGIVVSYSFKHVFEIIN